MLTYDQVLETFCLCDVKAYIKAKDGVVVFPENLRGARVEDVVKKAKGVVVKTEKGGYTHIFVVSRSAYLKKVATAKTPVLTASL